MSGDTFEILAPVVVGASADRRTYSGALWTESDHAARACVTWLLWGYPDRAHQFAVASEVLNGLACDAVGNAAG